MKKAEFIQVYADAVGAGRQKNFPDMRPSEKACARYDDEVSAAKHWRKSREFFAGLTPEEFRKWLDS